MIVVLDTNVLVSSLLAPSGQAARLVRILLEGVVDAALDDRILDEYHEVLSRREFSFDPATVSAMLSDLTATAEWVVPLASGIELPDPDDLPFLEVALATGAAGLVTGNKRHFPARLCRPVPVLSPTEFIQTLTR